MCRPERGMDCVLCRAVGGYGFDCACASPAERCHYGMTGCALDFVDVAARSSVGLPSCRYCLAVGSYALGCAA